MTKVPRNHTTMHPHSAGLPPKQTEADLLDNLARRVYELESSLIKARRDIDQLRKGNADLVRELDELKRKEGGGMTVGKRIPQIGECVRYLGGDFDVKRHRNITEGHAYEVTGFDPAHNAAEIRDNENDVWMIGEWNAEHYEVISNDPTAAMLTPDERDHYELDGRKLPAHYYIEGAHISPTPGKRKESDVLPYAVTYAVLARLFGGNESVILAAFDSEEEANDFAEQFRAKRHPDYKDVKVESAGIQYSADIALMDYFGDPDDDGYEDEDHYACGCCRCCGCECE